MIQSVKPEESLSHRVARGGAWIFALRIIEKGLGLIRLVIFGVLKIMETAENIIQDITSQVITKERI